MLYTQQSITSRIEMFFVSLLLALNVDGKPKFLLFCMLLVAVVIEGLTEFKQIFGQVLKLLSSLIFNLKNAIDYNYTDHSFSTAII